jgi:sugar phosphate isomerase/epimerase
MRIMLRNLIGIIFLVVPVLAKEAPAFYAFQNGMKFASVDEGVNFIKDLGYQGLGSVYPKELVKFKAACDKQGLKVFSIYAGGTVNADGFVYEKEVSEAITLLKGTDALVELNVQRGNDPNDAQAAAFVKEIASKAKEAGLKVVLYPHSAFYIERVDHALQIARATGCDNVGVAFNLCHFLKVQPTDDLSNVLELAKPLLWSVSLCGADTDGTDWTTLIRPLDEGSFDQVALLRSLREIGYKHPVGLQCFNIKIDPRQNLMRSMAAWKKHLAAARFETTQP